MIKESLLRGIARISYRREKRKYAKKLKIISQDSPVPMCFLPTDKEKYAEVETNFFREFGYRMPSKEDVDKKLLGIRDNGVISINPEDVRVLWGYWDCVFVLNDIEVHIHFKPGFIFDGASVPDALAEGRLNRNAQHVIFASMVHDLIFELNLFTFKETAHIFRQLIIDTKLVDDVIAEEYFFGVRCFVGKKLYKTSLKRSNDNIVYNGYYNMVKRKIKQ